MSMNRPVVLPIIRVRPYVNPQFSKSKISGRMNYQKGPPFLAKRTWKP